MTCRGASHEKGFILWQGPRKGSHTFNGDEGDWHHHMLQGHTSGSPRLGAGSNCRKFFFMASFTSRIAAIFPAGSLKSQTGKPHSMLVRMQDHIDTWVDLLHNKKPCESVGIMD